MDSQSSQMIKEAPELKQTNPPHPADLGPDRACNKMFIPWLNICGCTDTQYRADAVASTQNLNATASFGDNFDDSMMRKCAFDGKTLHIQ